MDTAADAPTQTDRPSAVAHVRPLRPPTREAVRAALPSWRGGGTLDRLVEGLLTLTTGPSAVAPQHRVAALDNDGTITCEKPYTATSAFLADAQGSSDHLPEHEVLEGLALTFAGITVSEYAQAAQAFLARSRHPDLDRPWVGIVYQPMIELVDLLLALEFTVVIATGSSRDFIRVMSDDTYHLPREHVVGSEVTVEWKSGQVVRTRHPEPVDKGPGKPAHVWSRLGRLPLVVAGNTREDTELLECAALAVLVDHDDPDREYEYHDEDALRTAEAQGWVVASMRHDWGTVFPPGPDGA